MHDWPSPNHHEGKGLRDGWNLSKHVQERSATARMPNPATMTEGHGYGQNNGIQRTLGRLEEAVERISGTLERSDQKSAEERQRMTQTLDEINGKVDPLLNRLELLEMTVDAQ